MRKPSFLPLAALAALFAASAPQAFAQDAPKPPTEPVHCALGAAPAGFDGGCGVMFDDGTAPSLSLASIPKVESLWRDDKAPAAVFKGATHEANRPDYAAELEVFQGGWGVLRTEYGWFPVSGFSDASGLAFEVDSAHEVAPNGLDDFILQRAAEIASNEAAWNRADDRRCGEHPKTWSIYCAMEQATTEVTGAPQHRRPAMEVVRVLVEERTRDRAYKHRLMDYNNDPSTKLEDIKALFQDASLRLHDDGWLKAHGFVDWPAPQ
jgi:hypothetical protein